MHVAHRLYDKRIRGAIHYHIAAAFDGNTLLCVAINVPGMHTCVTHSDQYCRPFPHTERQTE